MKFATILLFVDFVTLGNFLLYIHKHEAISFMCLSYFSFKKILVGHIVSLKRIGFFEIWESMSIKAYNIYADNQTSIVNTQYTNVM